MGGYFSIQIQIRNPFVHTFHKLCLDMLISGHILRYDDVSEHQNAPPIRMSRRWYCDSTGLNYLLSSVALYFLFLFLFLFLSTLPYYNILLNIIITAVIIIHFYYHTAPLTASLVCYNDGLALYWRWRWR